MALAKNASEFLVPPRFEVRALRYSWENASLNPERLQDRIRVAIADYRPPREEWHMLRLEVIAES
jgi:hypothetical protein